MYKLAASFTVLILMGCTFSIANVCLKVIQSIPMQYRNALPSSNPADYDQDGILDYIDDSDGDGIPDLHDATPYGKEFDRLKRTRQLFGG